ncbi:MAG: recombinase family protein [Colwellia sp.]|nr:recombinase family protein [Colwellia sp.]
MISETVGYIRFSSDRQAEGDSVERQRTLILDVAKGRGLEVDRWVLDEGVSAFHGDNLTGALGGIIAEANSGKFKGTLLVENLDRISRQHPEKALQVLLNLMQKGVTVITCADNREHSSGGDPMNLFNSLITFIRGNEESVMKSRRANSVWASNRDKLKDGLKIKNAYIPRWLEWSADDLIIIEEKAELIRRMFKLCTEGLGYSAISKILNNESIPTLSGLGLHRASGVAHFIKNRSVIGEYQPHTNVDGKRQPVGEAIADYYPSISEDLFYRAAGAVAIRNNYGSGGYRRGSFTNLFSGLIRCACGEMMLLKNKGKAGIDQHYLLCPSKDYGSCEQKSIRYDVIEKQIIVALSILPDVNKTRDNGAAIDSLNGRLITLSKARDELVEVLVQVPSKAVTERLVAVEKDINKLSEDIEALKREGSSEHGFKIIDVDDRPKFNQQLKSCLSMELIDNVIAYRNLDGNVLLEQHFGVKYRASKVLNMEGEVLAETKTDIPLRAKKQNIRVKQ